MTGQDLKPYAEAIVRLAMTTLHHALTLPMIENVIRGKLWEKPAAMFDLVK